MLLRAAGLITYPSPLLGGLLEKVPEMLATEVLPRVEPAGRALVARVDQASRAVVMASGLPRAGTSVEVPLKMAAFIGSIELLAWANESGCLCDARTCAAIFRHGQQQVLQWARAHGCPWSEDLVDGNLDCCALAARGGDLDLLRWSREHGCPWNRWTVCALPPLGTGTWRCCSGRGRTDASGARRPLRAGTSRCSTRRGCGFTVCGTTRRSPNILVRPTSFRGHFVQVWWGRRRATWERLHVCARQLIYFMSHIST